jgi:hypothetical protein
MEFFTADHGLESTVNHLNIDKAEPHASLAQSNYRSRANVGWADATGRDGKEGNPGQ